MFLLDDSQISIPHLFRCPISLDLFADPVTLSTGQTYDRSSIEKWLAYGNLTCPVTMQRLHDLSLVPNHTLRHLIHQWLLLHTQFDTKHIKPIALDFSWTTLKEKLQSPSATSAMRLETLRKIRTLAEQSDLRKLCLIQLGFFPLLLQLLFRNHFVEAHRSHEDSDLYEEAVNCVLILLSGSKMGSLNMLMEASNLSSFLILFEHGNINVKINLCHVVEAIASSSETRELCLVIGKTRSILQALISVLVQKSNFHASDAAAGAISGLCSLELNRGAVIGEGGIDGLISYLSNSDRVNTSRALATLEALLELESGKSAVKKNPNAVHVLVKLVFRVSNHEGSENAVDCLSQICYGSIQIREEAICQGVLTQLLLLLQSQCSCRTKTKAMLLLKSLRSMWADDSRICNYLQCGLVDC